MQVDQRMDLDRLGERDYNPVKSSLSQNNENVNAITKAKGKKVNGRKRAFGQDLTNQHLANAHTRANTGADSDYLVSKPQVMVMDQQPLAKKRKITIENDDDSCGAGRGDDDKHEEADETHRANGRSQSPPSVHEGVEMDEIDEEHVDDEDEEEDADGDETMAEILPEPLAKWDEADRSKDLCVTDYVDEIMANLRLDEQRNDNGTVVADEVDFMGNQNDINQRMRTVLVDWLIEVHRKFRLLPATFFLGINLLDRYLVKRQLHRRRLQLAGCTCLWIASKYHEIYAPEMADFVYISDNAFTEADMMEMEIEVLKTLSFTLTVPTVLNFAARYSKMSAFYLRKEREMKIIHDLIMYCVEQCVLSYDLCRKLPSLLGAAAFVFSCVSTKTFSVQTFQNDALQRVIGYSLAELKPTMRLLHETLKAAKKSKYKALYKKYSNPKNSNIAKLNFDKLHTSFLDEKN